MDVLANPYALMIDIECLSLRPEARILQVGAVVSNVRTGMVLKTMCYWMDQAEQAHRHVDNDTVGWWCQQDETVVKSVFNAPEGQPRTKGRQVFAEMGKIVELYDPVVWAAPAMFDLPTLFSLWEGEKPWSYKKEEDMTTLSNIFDPERALRLPESKMAHNALDDAGAQMVYLIALLSKAREVMQITAT